MASVSISNVQKAYGATRVIHGVDVDINDGEFVVLVGPSGCGKSTLLRMIAGLETISGGDIAIGSRVVNDMPPKQRDIAMVFQSYALYPHMTVSENMAFSLRVKGASPEEKKEKVAQAAAILGLESLLERYPKELSGGQRQRVAMGRAIVRNPQVFLFDEPLSNLDAKLRVQMRAEIKQLHQRLGTTTVYVTHDQIEAMTMADKIVVMRDGKVEQIGSPMELYDTPANLFVASFIGSPSTNFLSGSIKAENRSVFETAAGARLDLGFGAADALIDRPLVMGVRPERVDVTGEGEGLPATVSVVEPTGAETVLLVRHGSETITASTDARSKFTVGSRVGLRIAPESVHLFDKDTGIRLVDRQVEPAHCAFSGIEAPPRPRFPTSGGEQRFQLDVAGNQHCRVGTGALGNQHLRQTDIAGNGITPAAVPSKCWRISAPARAALRSLSRSLTPPPRLQVLQIRSGNIIRHRDRPHAAKARVAGRSHRSPIKWPNSSKPSLPPSKQPQKSSEIALCQILQQSRNSLPDFADAHPDPFKSS